MVCGYKSAPRSLTLVRVSNGSWHGRSRNTRHVLANVHRRPEDGPDRDIKAEALYRQSTPTPVGSEYGEGFIEFNGMKDITHHLDVDTLNEKLKVSGRERMRHAMKPDEAFGMIFAWDGVVANTRALQREAWMHVARDAGLPWPAIDRPQIYSVRPERAVMDILQWTKDWGAARSLAHDVVLRYADSLQQLTVPCDGISAWLNVLQKVNVPTALVTSLDRQTATRVLNRMGLDGAFRTMVTAEDGMETIAQHFLSAAIKLHRPPNQCVVFESCPQGITAAHNCTMKAVAVQGVHRGYELKQADLTCSNLSELTVYNIRRLFANKGVEFMDLQKAHGQSQRKAPMRGRRIANGTFD